MAKSASCNLSLVGTIVSRQESLSINTRIVFIISLDVHCRGKHGAPQTVIAKKQSNKWFGLQIQLPWPQNPVFFSVFAMGCCNEVKHYLAGRVHISREALSAQGPCRSVAITSTTYYCVTTLHVWQRNPSCACMGWLLPMAMSKQPAWNIELQEQGKSPRAAKSREQQRHPSVSSSE